MSKGTLPPPVHSDIYSAEWCDGMGGIGSNELFVRSGGQVIRPRLAGALRLGGVRPGMSVLDIGCGRGEVIIKCAQAGASLAAGLDYAFVPLETACKNVQRMGLCINSARSSLVLSRADAKALPFGSESFDRVFMLDIVEHLLEWELQQVWGEVWRVLKPDGLLIIHTLPNRWAVDYGYWLVRRLFRAWLVRRLFRALPANLDLKRDVFHVNEQSVVSLRLSLRRAGFAVRVWLEDGMLSQAAWAKHHQLTTDVSLKRVYDFLLHPVVRVAYKIAVVTPFRLFIANDLFAVAWKTDAPPTDVHLPHAYLETLVGKLAGGA